MPFAFNVFTGTFDLTGGSSGGTVTGSGASPQIAFWNSASSITGDADFTWTTPRLTITPTAAAQGGIRMGSGAFNAAYDIEILRNRASAVGFNIENTTAAVFCRLAGGTSAVFDFQAGGTLWDVGAATTGDFIVQDISGNRAIQVIKTTDNVIIGTSATDNAFWDNTNARLGLGTITPGQRLEASGAVQGGATLAMTLSPVSSAAGPRTRFAASRTSIAAPSAVQSGDQLGTAQYLGHDGSAYTLSAEMRVFALENFGMGARGTKFQFRTVAPTTTTLTPRVEILALASDAGALRIFEPGGVDYTEFSQPAMAAPLAYTLPTTAPNGVLTNTAGALSWAAASTGTVTSITNGIGVTPNPSPLSTTGQLDLDINSLTTGTVSAANDFFPMLDVSVGTGPSSGRKIIRSDILGAELEGLRAFATNGFLARTGAGIYAGRTITAGTGITVTNGNGSADPIIALSGRTVTSGTIVDQVISDVAQATFTVTDANVTTSSIIVVVPVNELDRMTFDVRPAAGSFDLTVSSAPQELNGYLNGKYNFAYTVVN